MEKRVVNDAGIRRSLVIGGTRGTGLHFVNSLLEAGEVVEAVGRRESPDFVEHDGQLLYHQCDLAKEDSVKRLIETFAASENKFTSVIFFQRYRGSEPNWKQEIDVCLSSTNAFLEAIEDITNQEENCSVVIVGSVAQDYIFPDQSAAYHVTKAGLRALVRFHAVKHGPRKVRVNLVVPATILKEEAQSYYDSNPDVFERKSGASPLGRMGTPSDVGSAIRFLESDGAAFITGQQLVVDGGMTLLGHEFSAAK